MNEAAKSPAPFWLVRGSSVGFWTVFGATLIALSARGDDSSPEWIDPLVLLISLENCCPDEAWPEAETAVAAELAALQLQVEIIDGKPEGEEARHVELESVARSHEAACAVRIQRSPVEQGGRVDLWIADRVTGKTTVRTLEFQGRTGAAAVAIAALRTVEALRASLIELRLVSAAPDQVEPSPELRELVDDARLDVSPSASVASKELNLGIGAGPAGSPGGVGVIGGVNLAFGWQPLTRLYTELEATISVLVKDVEEHGASSSFDLAMARVWGLWTILDRGWLRPMLGIGVGPVFSWTRGHDARGFSGKPDRVAVAYLGGTGQLGLALSRVFWIKLGARLGALIPEVRVLFAGDEVATFGRPIWEGFAKVEVWFL